MSERRSNRRGFLVGAAATLSAPAAALASATTARDPAELAWRVAALEDANAIRELQDAYARDVGARLRIDARELFADPAGAPPGAAIASLSLAAGAQRPAVEIAPDRGRATARVPCAVVVETPIAATGCSLVDMARLQGEGVVRCRENGVLEQTFVRRDGVWILERTALTRS